MIETTLRGRNHPPVVVHRVVRFDDEAQTRKAIDEAIAIIRDVASTDRGCGLVIDMRDYSVSDISLHRLWSTEFKENKEVLGAVHSVAIVGGDSPAFRAEKELLESEALKFFTDLEGALSWLGSQT